MDSWIPITLIWIRKGGRQIFGLTGAKSARNTWSIATQSLMRVRCSFGEKCMSEWAARTRALCFAATGNYGQRWHLREESHTWESPLITTGFTTQMFGQEVNDLALTRPNISR